MVLLVTALPIDSLKGIERQQIGDKRGFLARLFCADELSSAGWTKPISQINHTRTAKVGTVRGMHFQYPPSAEIKLVSCIRGEIWDVAIDLRANSPTFLQWHAEHLSADNGRALLIPEGFAHGFQTLTDDVDMVYCHSAPYVAAAEGGLNPLDPYLKISWPLPIAELSIRDSQHRLIDAGFEGLKL